MKKELDIKEYLIKNDIKPSLQRIKIYDYLVKHRNHPTVEMIYHDLIDEMQTLSKTTIYNTLKLFVEKQVVSMITIDEHEARFDADTKSHGHFKCTKCGTVYDIDLGKIDMKLQNIKSFDVHETQVYLKGICDKCKKRK